MPLTAATTSDQPSMDVRSMSKDADSEKPTYATELQPVQSNTSLGSASGEGTLRRGFGPLAALGLAFALLNSWTAMSASLSVVLTTGGAVSMMWGLVVSTLGTLAMALSMAELCHVYCTTGGQIDWTYILAPDSIRLGLTFFEGWMAVSGWVNLVATGCSLGAAFIVQLIGLWSPDYVPANWHTFLCFLACAIWGCSANIFGVRLLPLFDTVGMIWCLAGFVIVSVIILVTARGNYQTAAFVWTHWNNTTGWPDGFAFILGLLQSTFSLTGFDAVCKLVDEMPKPSVNAPRAMVGAILMGAVTSWIFLVCLLFCLNDFDAVLTSAAGPMIAIYQQATSSRIGATGLVMFNIISMFFNLACVVTGGSRMVWAFAKDSGFGPLSGTLAHVHPKLLSPVSATLFTGMWVAIFGLIFLGSSTALNAIMSASVVLLQISYIIPIALIFWHGEAGFDRAPHGTRKMSLGRLRRPINAVALAFALMTTVAFFFPTTSHPSGSSMSYVVVVVAIVLVLIGITWLVDGRKHFRGPLELDARLAAAAREMDEVI